MPKLNYNRFILFSSIAVIALGVYVVILDILFHFGFITSQQVGNLPLATDAAICFIFLGLSLWIRVKSKPVNALSYTFAAGAIVCALASLSVSIFGQPLAGFHFGMSPQTAICFILLCIAMAGIENKVRIYRLITQWVLNLVTFISFVVIVGHLFTVPLLHQFSLFPSMAFYSAVAFCLFSVAAALLNPDVGITGMFTGNKIGNAMARRLFIQMLFSVLLIGYIHLEDHRNNWLSEEVGTALQTIVLATTGLLFIWETTRSANKSGEKQRVAEENFKLAFNSSPYALVLSDRQGKIMMANKETELLYGYAEKELIGLDVKVVIPPHMHENYELNKERFFAKKKVLKLGNGDEEILALSRDGREFPIELTLIPVQTEEGMISMASVIDLTYRKTYEKIIKDQVAELQVKNTELEQFSYIASHDLQEPLRTVSNYIQLLEEDYPEQINDEIKIHLGVMGAAVGRMGILINSLLEYAKLGKNKQLSLTDCNAVVSHVIADLNNLIKNNNARIEVLDKLPTLYAYETELRQLFQNLINNAIKFRKEGVAPEIKIGCVQKDGYTEVSVQDNGIGIAHSHSRRIFDIFQRLHSESEYEGHGIGLANCKKIVDMHGGKIWVESQPGKGSIFKFTLMNLKA